MRKLTKAVNKRIPSIAVSRGRGISDPCTWLPHLHRKGPLGGGTVAREAEIKSRSKPLLRPLPHPWSLPTSQFGTGGVALRNRSSGSISVSGVVSPLQAAYLYWAVITAGPPKAANQTITIARQFPTPGASASVTGIVVGSGEQPCWTGDTITVFRAVVPLNVATETDSTKSR